MPRQAVDAPQARPPRYSLLLAAPAIEDSVRWEAGVEFAPEGCGAGGRVAIDCIGGTDLLDPPANPAWVTADAFGVWAADQCSTFGYRARDYAGRARRQLLATQSFQVAAELWSGSLAGDPILLGSSLTNENVPLNHAGSDTLTNGAVEPIVALADVVSALGSCSQGRQGMIHMTPQVLQYLIRENALVRDSGLWYSAMGHLVVADDGYDGSAPGGAPASTSQWIYGTSMVEVRLGQIQIVPALDETGLGGDQIGWEAAVDPATNLVTVIAQRPALTQWDHCCHVAAEVNVAPPLVNGAS